MSFPTKTLAGTLERAIAIAVEVHAGATDKAGAPYILHPLRVMQSLSDQAARIVAVLHDVVEDGGPDWTIERLRMEGFSDAILQGIAAVTKNPDEEDAQDDTEAQKLAKYLRFVRRAATDPLGWQVKLADLNDNLDLTRLRKITERDTQRINKYLAAREVLMNYSAY